MNDEMKTNEVNEGTPTRVIRSAAGFIAGQVTLAYLFWIMFFGEVIRWKDAADATYRPIRDAFLIPFADIFIVPHHWVGKILTGTIIIVVLFYAFRLAKRCVEISEDKLIRYGYYLVASFWAYSLATLLYFIGHINKFWFF